MTDIADTAINGVPNYDMYVMSMFEAMEFRGKPLSTWEQELNFNELGDRIDHNELKAYNLDFVNKSRIILNKEVKCSYLTLLQTKGLTATRIRW